MGARLACPGCGADWSGTSARFCGRCGQVLMAAPDAGGRARAAPRRGAPVFVAAVALLVAGAGLAVFLAALDTGRAPAADRVVELPGAADGGPAGSTQGQDVACAPAPCERWRAVVGPGEVLVIGDVAYHRSPTQLAALDVAAGGVLWSQPSDTWPSTTSFVLRGGGGQAWDLGDGLLVFANHLGGDGVLEARSATDGSLRWTRPFVGRLQPFVAIGAGEQVVVAAYDPVAADGRGRVLGFDAEDGTMTWSVQAYELFATFLGELGASQTLLVVGTGEDEVAGLDPATGEPRWTRTGVEHVVVATGGASALVAADGVAEVVEVASGQTQGSFDLELASDVWMHLHGEVLLVRDWGPDESEPGLAVYSSRDGSLLADQLGTMVGPVLADDGSLVVGTLREADGGADAGTIDLMGIGADGEVRWRTVLEVAWRECCWNLVDARDDQSVLVAALWVRDAEVIRIGWHDGTMLERLELQPVPGAAADDDGFAGHPLLRMHSQARDTVLSGPAGVVELGGGPAEVVSMDPLLVAVGDTLIALEESALLGDLMRPRWEAR